VNDAVQNYHWDPAGRLRWRGDEGDAGLPPSAARIVSPYDLAARYARRGQVTRWAGYLAHVTETCSAGGPAYRRPLHQGPVPALPGAGRLHHLRRRQAHRGIPPARTARTAGT